MIYAQTYIIETMIAVALIALIIGAGGRYISKLTARQSNIKIDKRIYKKEK